MSKRGNLRAFAQWGALCVFLLSVISDVRAQNTPRGVESADVS